MNAGMLGHLRHGMNTKTTKISIHTGEFDFEAEGGQFEVEERISQYKQEGFWGAMLERIQETVELSKESLSNTSNSILFPQEVLTFGLYWTIIR